MISIVKTIRINARVEDVYRFWKDLENFPDFVHSVESVRKLDEKRSHWILRGPFGIHVEFESESTEEKENELLRWKSREGGGLTKGMKSEGELRFVPVEDGKATDVHVKLDYGFPNRVAEKIGAVIKSVGYPDRQFNRGLREIKESIEMSEMRE